MIKELIAEVYHSNILESESRKTRNSLTVTKSCEIIKLRKWWKSEEIGGRSKMFEKRARWIF